MNYWSISWLIASLIGLIVLSALFSCSETSLMALNRYRLRHLAHKKNRAALRVLYLLKRPDRILGVILLGNTFANILASSIATIIAEHYWGNHRIWLVTILLTFVILIFSEIGPKTLAVLYPQKIAFPFSWPLSILLKIAMPLLWLVNGIANFSLRIFGVNHLNHPEDALSAEELRTLVHETRGKISHRYQKMLLRILDLEKISVDDVMVPRSEIYGIDLTEAWSKVEARIFHCPHHRVPVYRESLDQLEGVLSIRQALLLKTEARLNLESLKTCIKEPYFVPEGTFLSQQLRNFEKTEHSLAFVVDEYGDIQGLINLNDILQEIIGEFSSDFKELQERAKRDKPTTKKILNQRDAPHDNSHRKRDKRKVGVGNKEKGNL